MKIKFSVAILVMLYSTFGYSQLFHRTSDQVVDRLKIKYSTDRNYNQNFYAGGWAHEYTRGGISGTIKIPIIPGNETMFDYLNQLDKGKEYECSLNKVNAITVNSFDYSRVLTAFDIDCNDI